MPAAPDEPATDGASLGVPDAPHNSPSTEALPTDAPVRGAKDADQDAGVPPSQTRTRIVATAALAAIVAFVILLIVLGGTDTPATQLSSGDILGPVAGAGTVIGTEPSTTETTTPETLPAATQTPTTPTTRKPRAAPTGPPGPLTNAAVDRNGYEERAAIVVKIDNDDLNARPQAGLSLADVVYEEKVEGAYTRFAAVFQGSDANPVGPVRSARTTDVGIVGALNFPLFAYSGANTGVLAVIAEAPQRDVGAGVMSGAYFRGYDHPVPHNLYTNTSTLWRAVGSNTPLPLWGFRGPRDALGPNARRTSGTSMQFGGGVLRVVWRWNADTKTFHREQNGRVHFDVDNWPVEAANVVIQQVEYVDSGFVDKVGATTPEAKLIGTGSGWILSGGFAIPVNWEKRSLEERTIYWDDNRQPVNFLPGRTWVELLPVENGVSIAN